jgi:spermidine synthase
MFEELDFQRTPLGDLILRRRESVSRPGLIVYEVTLDGEFLMSSVVNDSEIALSSLGLSALEGEGPWEVMVGGLGLGYTAAAALQDPRVRQVTVVELLEPVLQWHLKGLVPLGAQLSADPRCQFRHADFFEVMGAAPEGQRDTFDAILIDIDHSPQALLQPQHAAFYQRAGVENLARHLRPGGVVALWSADPLSEDFVAEVGRVFGSVKTHTVDFYNPFMGEEDQNTVLVGKR